MLAVVFAVVLVVVVAVMCNYLPHLINLLIRVIN